MESINFKSGEVSLNDFDFVDNKSYAEQLWSFKEDILQVVYQDFVLDLGWYPEFDLEKGSFRLVIVKDENWMDPIYCKRTQSISEVRELIMEAVELAERISK